MNDDNVKVIVRCRPLNSEEQGAGTKDIVRVDRTLGNVRVGGAEGAVKEFTFDAVYDKEATQDDIFSISIRPLVDAVLEGYNATVFAYGQTGSGKTFTMTGCKTAPGIIPGAFTHIFDQIGSESNKDKEFVVTASFLEIYNEQICDLIEGQKGNNRNLQMRFNPERGVFVPGLTEHIVQSDQAILRLLERGNANRHVAATLMNERSSRSHSIFQVKIECGEMVDGEQRIRVGKLNLVDLAGSETQDKTQSKGNTLKEAGNINLSLTKLGMVMRALVTGQRHVPYRDSKLTMLLQDSLGGNAKTLMIANVSPAGSNYSETCSTLRYADSAKQIKNKPKINEDPKDALLRKMKEQIEKLEEELQRAQKVELITQREAEDAATAEDPGAQTIEDEIIVQQQIIERPGATEEQVEAAREEIMLRIEEAKKRHEQQLRERERKASEAAQRVEEMQNQLSKVQALCLRGEQLQDKTRLKEAKLREARSKLAEKRHKEDLLKREILRREQEQKLIAQEFQSLQEANEAKQFQIEHYRNECERLQNELLDVAQQHEVEKEDIFAEMKKIGKDLSLAELVIDSFIPFGIFNRICDAARFNEETGEFIIPFAEYAGGSNASTPTYAEMCPRCEKFCSRAQLYLEDGSRLEYVITDNDSDEDTVSPCCGNTANGGPTMFGSSYL